MPAVIRYTPPTDKGREQFASAAVVERRRLTEKYLTALRYYEGDQPKQVVVEEDEPDDNVTINMVKMTAERTSAFLFPEEPDVTTDPENIEQTDEEIWAEEFIESFGGLTFLNRWVLRGFLAGHSYIKLTVDPTQTRFATVTLLDPTSVTVHWKADETARVLWYEQRYFVGDDLYIQDIVWNEKDGTWTTYIYLLERAGGRYLGIPTPVSSYRRGMSQPGQDGIRYGARWQLVDTVKHPSTIPPILDTPHLPHPDDYYGLGEFNNTDLQDTINRLASEINRIVRENSDPVDIVTGADVEDVDKSDAGDILTIANPAARVTRLEMKSDVAALKDLLTSRMDIYLALCRVVLLKGEAKDLQRVTNASVRTLFLDMLAKNRQLQAAYGATLKKMIMLGIQMSDLPNRNQPIKVKIGFASALPIDETEIANVNAIQTSIGARSAQTAAEKIGDDWAREQPAIEAEAQANMERQRAQMEMAAEFAPDPAEGQPGKSGQKPPEKKSAAKDAASKATGGAIKS